MYAIKYLLCLRIHCQRIPFLVRHRPTLIDCITDPFTASHSFIHSWLGSFDTRWQIEEIFQCSSMNFDFLFCILFLYDLGSILVFNINFECFNNIEFNGYCEMIGILCLSVWFRVQLWYLKICILSQYMSIFYKHIHI